MPRSSFAIKSQRVSLAADSVPGSCAARQVWYPRFSPSARSGQVSVWTPRARRSIPAR